ncbi:transcriptional regulator, partial [Mycobacterium sp. ITM-2017-0098]
TAQAAGVSEQTIRQAEADEPVSSAEVDAIETLVSQIV